MTLIGMLTEYLDLGVVSRTLLFSTGLLVSLVPTAVPVTGSHLSMKVSDVGEIALRLSTLADQINAAPGDRSAQYVSHEVPVII